MNSAGSTAVAIAKERAKILWRGRRGVRTPGIGAPPRRTPLSRGLECRLSSTLEIRAEAFNVLNHPQFYGAGAVDGNIVSPTFGNVLASAAPRFVQLAAKLSC